MVAISSPSPITSTARGSTIYRHQILTTEVDPRSLAWIGKGVTGGYTISYSKGRFMRISNRKNPFISMVYGYKNISAL